jgi:hypothetical protein
MRITATDRQARLRHESAERFPTLPVRMWTSATCLAELVVSRREAQADPPETHARGRALSVADFQFRGGFPGWSRGLCARTRCGDHAVLGSLEPIRARVCGGCGREYASTWSDFFTNRSTRSVRPRPA